jgi:4-amino-4-deoxy-L-arabinose transferase-like glycosyltransferase
VLPLLVLVGILLVRFVRLGADGLWVDEAWTALLVRESPGRLLDLLRADDAPPLFYALQALVSRLAGDSEWGVRLLPALCGAGAGAAPWSVCRRHAPQAAIPAAVALGFSTVAVHYSRQARSYALLHLLTALAIGAALALRDRPGRRSGACFVLACLGLAYSHNLGILVVVAAVVAGPWPLFRVPGQRRTGGIVVAALVAGLLPWLVALLPQLGVHESGNAWMGLWWKGRGSVLLGPFYTLVAMANGAAAALRPTVPLPAFPGPVRLLAWVSGALVAAGLASAVAAHLRSRTAGGRPAASGSRRRPSPEVESPRFLLGTATLFTAVPLLGLVAVSVLVGPAYVVGRTDTLALPGLSLLLGLGWTRLPHGTRLAVPATWAILGLVALYPSIAGTGSTAKGSDRDLARLLGEQVAPGDAVVFAPLTRPTLEYYGRRMGWWDRAGWKGSFPPAFDRNAAAPWPTPLDSAATWQAQGITMRREWERQGAGTTWILALRDPASPRGPAPDSPWPGRPARPPADRASAGAAALGYPANVLVSALAGLGPAEVAWEYRQDWVSGERMVLRLPRSTWVPEDSIPHLETRP